MDVLVFQMGKVGSSAITRALCERGLNAAQTHWLDKDTLIGSLEDTLLNVELDDAIAFRGADDWMQNLRNIRLLHWYQRFHRRDGKKLRIVTLARDPLNWYWGHLAENFDLYGRCIEDWYQRVFGEPPEDTRQATWVFHQALFQCFGRIQLAVTDAGFAQAAANQRFKGVSVPFLAEQMMKLRLPTVWFDVFFKPSLNIDIYRQPLDADSGTAYYENDYARLMLIRYENLHRAVNALADFLNLSELTLQRSNPTAGKNLPFDITEFVRTFEPDRQAVDMLHQAAYSRFFRYGAE